MTFLSRKILDYSFATLPLLPFPPFFYSFPPVPTMATKTLEARFEHLSVKDEKENGSDRTYSKHKVLELEHCGAVQHTDLVVLSRDLSRRPSLYLASVLLR